MHPKLCFLPCSSFPWSSYSSTSLSEPIYWLAIRNHGLLSALYTGRRFLFRLTGWKNTLSQNYDPHSEAGKSSSAWYSLLWSIFLMIVSQAGPITSMKVDIFDHAPEYRLFRLQYIPRLARIKSPEAKFPG